MDNQQIEKNHLPGILCQEVVGNIEKVIVGKRSVSELLLVSLIAGGHILLDDVPGVGKLC